jgi:hypothetical protein
MVLRSRKLMDIIERRQRSRSRSRKAKQSKSRSRKTRGRNIFENINRSDLMYLKQVSNKTGIPVVELSKKYRERKNKYPSANVADIARDIVDDNTVDLSNIYEKQNIKNRMINNNRSSIRRARNSINRVRSSLRRGRSSLRRGRSSLRRGAGRVGDFFGKISNYANSYKEENN